MKTQEMFEKLLTLPLDSRAKQLHSWVRYGECSETLFGELLPLCTGAGFDLARRHVAAHAMTWSNTDTPPSVVFDQLEKNLKHLKVLLLDPASRESFNDLIEGQR